MALRDTKTGRELEIRDDGSTMDRFKAVTRCVLGVSREDVRKTEAEWKSGRKCESKK